MIINGFNYLESEIKEALQKKGYCLLPHQIWIETPIHGSGFQREYFDTYCAVIGSELPSYENQWHKVALKEFEKKLVKPPLV